MASTTTNGVIKEVPYGILNNFRTSLGQSFVVSVVGRDQITRLITSEVRRLNANVYVYRGDEIYYELIAPAKDGNLALFDASMVDPSSGAVTLQATFTALMPGTKSFKLVIMAIDGTSGSLSFGIYLNGVEYVEVLLD